MVFSDVMANKRSMKVWAVNDVIKNHNYETHYNIIHAENKKGGISEGKKK